MHPKKPIRLQVNGRQYQLEIEARVTLLDALRECLDLTGTKKGCDHGQCGACTVHINVVRINSCLTFAIMHEGDAITTIEGLATDGALHPVQEAFVSCDAFQCGYCTPGFVMATTAFLKSHPNPNEEQVKHGLGGNLCRCGTYMGIRKAALEAASKMGGKADA